MNSGPLRSARETRAWWQCRSCIHGAAPHRTQPLPTPLDTGGGLAVLARSSEATDVGAEPAASASSMRRATASMVSAYSRMTSRVPSSPQPATEGMDSPPTSSPADEHTTYATQSTPDAQLLI